MDLTRKPISRSSTSVASLRTTSCKDGDHLRIERKRTDATCQGKGEVDVVERLVARSWNVSERNAGRVGRLARKIATKCDNHTPFSRRTGIPRARVDKLAFRVLPPGLP